MASDIIERWKASALSTALIDEIPVVSHSVNEYRLLLVFRLPLLLLTHARSESINADSLNSNFLQLGRSGGRPQRAVHPMRLPVNTVIHTPLVGLEPATFRSLVDCWSDALPVVPPTLQVPDFVVHQISRYTC